MRLLTAVAAITLISMAAAGILIAEDAAPQPSESQVKDTGKVMVIREASQPQGFPKLTAVSQTVIKDYPAYRAARVSGEDAKRNRMFGTLFSHIKRNNIAMTAPVEMKYGSDEPTSMAFLYANTDTGDLGRDGSVEVVDVPAMKVISIGVRGDYTQARYQKNRQRLEEWLSDNASNWTADGQARYFAFNSPFVPGLLKYGEVQIPIRAAD